MEIKKNNFSINWVENANDFIGVEIENKEIVFNLPKVFREEKQNKQTDLIAFIKSISIAKNIEEQINHREAKHSLEDTIWPIDSFLWIIYDYLENGFYFNREKKYSKERNGKIEWKKTLKSSPLYSNGNLIYNDLTTSKVSASNDLITLVYKLCLRKSLDCIGWVFDYNIPFHVEQIKPRNELIYIVKKELSNTFDDMKRQRFNHMLNILESESSDRVTSNRYKYGTNNYYYAYEVMIDSYFGGIKGEKKQKFNPKGCWNLNGKESPKASSLRPDTILEYNDCIYILDSKFYKYGHTNYVGDLPQTRDMLKQITYGDYIHNVLEKEKVRNAFIIPFNKELKEFKDDPSIEYCNNENLRYIGYATGEWRTKEKVEDYDYIHTFIIDFNHLLRNHKKKDTLSIEKLCSKIEEKLKDLPGGTLNVNEAAHNGTDNSELLDKIKKLELENDELRQTIEALKKDQGIDLLRLKN